MSEDQTGVSLNFDSEASQNPQSEANSAPAPQAPEPTGDFELNALQITPTPAEAPVQQPETPVMQPETELMQQQEQPAAPTPQAENTLLYSSEDPANDQVDLNQAGFDLNIEQKVPAAEVELGKGTGNVVDSIVSQATVDKGHEDKILRELEQMDAKMELDMPVIPIDEKKVKTARAVFFGVLITAIAVLSYLFLGPSNGTARISNGTLDPLSVQKQELSDSRSELIASHYFVASIALQSAAENTAKLAVDFDVSESNFADFSQKQAAERNLDDYRDSIEASLKIAETEITSARKLSIESDEASSDLLLYLSGKEKQSANPSEKAKLQSALNLYSNDQILNQIKELNFVGSNEELLNQLQPIMASLKSNDLGRLAYVQTKRISWSQIISELERITDEVDPGMDNITYTGYTFDAEQNRINVTGQIQTEDEKTFTLITELVDSINQPDSPFVNASNTSFSKNASEENGFTSTIRLDFNLK